MLPHASPPGVLDIYNSVTALKGLSYAILLNFGPKEG